MSYILDALRKSDQQRQRQRGAVPTLEALPVMAPPPRRQPSWLSLALGGALLLAGLALGWWRPWEQVGPAVEQAEPSTPASPAQALLPTAAPMSVAAPPAVTPTTPPTLPPAATVANPPAPIQESRPAPLPQAPSPAPVAVHEAPDLESLPASFRQGLPPLVISFLIDAPAPLDRRAMIDNAMLRPGDSFGPDIFLEGISGNGVTLVYRGQRFRKMVHP